MCLRACAWGGVHVQKWVTLLSLTATPGSLQVLAEPFHLDRKGEVPAGKQQTYKMPVFTFSVSFRLSSDHWSVLHNVATSFSRRLVTMIFR